jgi:hypothetical protein
MMQQNTDHLRVLAVYPYRRGFGFAVLERGKLVDWGLARLYSKETDEFLTRVEAMIFRYAINIVAAEETTNARRSPVAKQKVSRLLAFGKDLDIQVAQVPAVTIRGVVGLEPKATNHELSSRIADYLPELAILLPRKRKFYEPEDDRTFVFKAVGLAIATLCG